MSETGAFEIDGVELWPQPDVHTWTQRSGQIQGFDGNGAPIPRKYRDLTLTVERNLNGQFNWDDFDDLAAHTVTAPAPNSTDAWADYAGCFCLVSHGKIDDAVSMQQITMAIRRAEA